MSCRCSARSSCHSAATPTLLVAWDAAEWNVIEPMIEAGELPNLEALLAGGLLGRFTVPMPIDPAVLATSLSTGLPPDVHGILAHPARAAERRVPDLAERFAAAGRLAISVGWPGSHGVAPRPNLLRVSDSFDAAPSASATDPWPLPPGSVIPETLAADIAEIRFHPAEFAPSDLTPLVADIGELDLAMEPRVSCIAVHLAASISRQSAASFLMENHPWQYAEVFFPGIEGISRECMAFQPPRLPHVSELEYLRYRRAVAETYRLHDQMLGRLVALAGPDAAILLVSSRGVESGDARPTPLAGEHVETAAFFRPAGFCLLRGPGLREDDLLHGVDHGDLAPTLLWLAGLGLPPGLPGRPLLQAIHAADAIAPPVEDSTLAHPPSPLQTLADDEAGQRAFHLAIAHMNAGRMAEALPLLERVCAQRPDRLGPVLYRINCLRGLGRPTEALALLERHAALPDGGLRSRPGLRARFFPHYDLMRGLLFIDEGRPDCARAHFVAALKTRPQHAGLHLHLARALLDLREWDGAEAALRQAIAIDPGEGEAHWLLGKLLSRLRRFADALQPAMEAAARLPHRSEVHLLLGFTLARLDRSSDAMFCLQNALRLAPGLRPAHWLLARLRRKNPGLEPLADRLP
jgi:tetratricopeptide (TPR) repeat protein